MKLSVNIQGLEEVKREMRDIHANQIPFASAATLTRLAKKSQALVQTKILPRSFHLRRKSFMERNIKIKAATKRVQEAVVFDNFDAMVKDEMGGVKVPTRGRKVVAVPLSGARSSVMQVIDKRHRPKWLMANGGFIRGNVLYWVPKRSKRGVIGAGNRRRGMQGPQPANAAAGPIRPMPMYALVDEATVRAQYGFAAGVVPEVHAQLASTFHEEFVKAVKTAK